MEFEEQIINYAEAPITLQVLYDLLNEYKRPHDKINDLIASGKLLRIKRGIYVTGSRLNIAPPSSYLLANHILGPSYVSNETALSYWGMIPERVYEINSMTVQKTVTFKTTVGRFSYTRIPIPYYSFGIKSESLTPKQRVLIATPEKAVCDKIITTSGILLRSTTQVADWLLENLRIDRDGLQNLNQVEISKWIVDAPKKNSLGLLVKTLARL